MHYLDEIDYNEPTFGDLWDELPLWSAPFGLLLLERVPMRRGMTILDLGSGTGFLTFELIQRCGTGTRVIAVDPWAAGANRVRRKVAHLGVDGVILLERDAASLALGAESVDLIVSNLGVNNFDNAPSVMAECARVAKPGAEMFITSNLVGTMAEFYDVFRTTLRELGQADALRDLDLHIAHRATMESIVTMLRDAGFHSTEQTTDSFRLRFADGSAMLRHHFMRLGFLPAWKAVVPAGEQRAVFDALERALNSHAERNGELSLTIPMGCVAARKA